MSVKYACSHTGDSAPTLPPVYPSSSSSYYPLSHLYFCEECDAIRCPLCVGVEVASYFCPNCLFDVPSANVRADKNQCARNCFSCPACESSLAVQAESPTGPYLLVCPGCRWSSRSIGWEFEKPTGLAAQSVKLNTRLETMQSQFDALKDHLETYLSLPSKSKATTATGNKGSSRQPTRHISQITQMAAKALGRDMPGLQVAKPVPGRTGVDNVPGKEGEKYGWDQLKEFDGGKVETKWKSAAFAHGQDMEWFKGLEGTGQDGMRSLQQNWASSWVEDDGYAAKSLVPQRIALRTKLTKRCPQPTCRHLLIQPDTKSTRMKIKMVAMNYLPEVEIGRRRRRIDQEDKAYDSVPNTAEEVERRRRERRRTRPGHVKEQDQDLDAALIPGEVYTYQVAFTNPLFDPIQIRLGLPHQKQHPHIPANHHVHIPTPHFTVLPLKDAWAYDEEQDDELQQQHGSEEASEEGSTVSGAKGTLGKRSRLSILAAGTATGSVRAAKGREAGVERKGNISKVGLEVEVMPDAVGRIEFDLEVRYTYRADDAGGDEVVGVKAGKEEYKTFTFWVRIDLGAVV